MAQIVRSVLLVDYDSLHASLHAHSALVGEWFAELSGHWLEALESGELLTPRKGEPSKRRLLVKRCYADPRLLGTGREGLIVQGFQIIDCLPLSGRERNAAELNLALDANDLLSHSATYDEFILISADTDLTPILFRLRHNNRATAIYAGPNTSTSYRAFADAVLEEKKLAAIVEAEHAKAGLQAARKPAASVAPTPPPVAPGAEPQPATAAVVEPTPAASQPGSADEEIATQATSAPDRAQLVELVRRVHQATKVPLFPTRTYADLFGKLADEISANGYHFQTTAESVASKMIAEGKNVTRRQIGFVVKGLSLKGHAFSAADRPETLAASFRDQVLYLAGIAPMELSDGDRTLISLWITGGDGAKVAETAPEQPAEPAKAAQPTAARAAAERLRKSAEQPRKTPPVSERAAAEPRPAGPTIAPAATPMPPPAEGIVIPPAESVEASILAAIAEAVDVLVDDTPDLPARRSARSSASPSRSKAAPPPPPPAAESDDDDGDIGSEIQKILSGFSQERKSGRR